jgi:hypothetical protein
VRQQITHIGVIEQIYSGKRRLSLPMLPMDSKSISRISAATVSSKSPVVSKQRRRLTVKNRNKSNRKSSSKDNAMDIETVSSSNSSNNIHPKKIKRIKLVKRVRKVRHFHYKIILIITIIKIKKNAHNTHMTELKDIAKNIYLG